VEWRVDVQGWQSTSEANVRTDDRDAILALAARVGLGTPRRVSFHTTAPGVCRLLLVSSAVVEANNRLTWREVAVYRNDWTECSHTRESGGPVQRRGRWTASVADLTEREEWRIRDGDWHVDVALGDGVTYEVAQLIVRAIRRHALISRLPSSIGPVNLDTSVPDIDAGDIEAIWQGRAESNAFEVRVGGRAGLTLTLKVLGEVVELHAAGTYTVRVDEPHSPERRIGAVLSRTSPS
jgi:hypothetical protein